MHVPKNREVLHTRMVCFSPFAAVPQDNFFVTLSPSTTAEGGLSGHGTDKLGSFVMEGSPLVGNRDENTW